MRRYTGTMDILCQRSRCLRDPGPLHSFVLKISFQNKIIDSLSELGDALHCPVSCLRLFHCGCPVNISPSYRWGDVPGIVWCPFFQYCTRFGSTNFLVDLCEAELKQALMLHVPYVWVPCCCGDPCRKFLALNSTEIYFIRISTILGVLEGTINSVREGLPEFVFRYLLNTRVLNGRVPDCHLPPKVQEWKGSVPPVFLQHQIAAVLG